jgi:hypothetical protein
MFRFLFTLVLIYFIVRLIKGLTRRPAPPQDRRRAMPRQEQPLRSAPRSKGVDYSKVKDADYRDL